jgi:hypothetical protein
MELQDARHHHSPPEPRGGVRSYGTHHIIGALPSREAGSKAMGRGSIGALSSREAGSEAIEHVAVLEPSRAGRWDPTLQATWWCTNARPALCMAIRWSLYTGVPDLQGTNSGPGSTSGEVVNP